MENTLQAGLFKAFLENKNGTALEYGSISMTYEELDKKSNYIANWICGAGYKKETVIGIYTDNRADLVTAILGILKAGCVFVPLDKAHPAKRIAKRVDFTDMALLLGDTKGLALLEGDLNTEKVTPLTFDALFAEEKTEWFENAPAVEYLPEDKLYIYFTSGTTGDPKAIVGNNKGLNHFIAWEKETFKAGPGFRVSQLVNPSFDPFLRDIFLPLYSGGTLCIPESEEIIIDAKRIQQWINESKVQLIHCVPSIFRLFFEEGVSTDSYKDLEYVLLAGEKVNPVELKKWYALFNDSVQLVNIYGPTETTLAKTFHFITQEDAEKVRIPVGQPIKGAQIIILDNDNDLCDELEVGELYIRTPYRTYGYYKNEEMNKKVFIQNPFTDNPADLIYKTGDIGRYLADGSIDLLGRADRQVKVRGVRLELSEVENIILKNDSIKEAVTTVAGPSEENKNLYAFITKKGATPDEELLKELAIQLAQELPEYSVPSRIFVIDEIPRKPNGKIDYQGLPDPLKMDVQEELKKPGNKTEEGLLEIWKEILKTDAIGIDSNFFALGGNSLNVMTLISKVHKTFDIRLSLGDVFKKATIMAQAEALAAQQAKQFKAIPKAEDMEYYPLSTQQRRLFNVQQFDTAGTTYNMTRSYFIEGVIDSDRFMAALKIVAQKHEAFRTQFIVVDGEPKQKVLDSVDFDVAYREVEEKDLVTEMDKCVTAFDLSSPPALKLSLLKYGEDKHGLVIDMHHIITDGISMGIFVKDLMIAYQGEDLQALPIQYKDYAVWQNSDKGREYLKIQEDFWLDQFKGDIPVLDLPTDYSRPEIQRFEGREIRFAFDKDISEAVRSYCKKYDVTMYMFMLSCLKVLLAKHADQEEIIIGSGASGREHADTEDIMGMFINTTVLRSFPEEGKKYIDYLEEVKKTTLGAIEHQSYPFENLIENLNLSRDPSRNPLFDVFFMVQNMNVGNLEIADMKFEPHNVENTISKFDISMHVWENDVVNYLLEYSTNLFSEETIRKMSDRFKVIVNTVLSKADIKIGEIEIFSQEEKAEKSAREYWRSLYSGNLPELELKTDFPKGGDSGFEKGDMPISLGAETAGGIKKLAATLDTEAGSILKSAMYALLHYYSNQNDIVLGAHFEGKQLPMRLTIDKHNSFKELISRCGQTIEDVTKHKDFPVEEIVKRKSYDVSVNLFASEDENIETNCDVALDITSDCGDLSGTLRYNKKLFKEDSVSRLYTRYRKVLDSMVKNVEGKIADVTFEEEVKMPSLGAIRRRSR